MTNVFQNNKFYKIKVSNIIKETDNTHTLYLEIPNDLSDLFKYKAGQYLTLKININDKIYRRSYSISTSPEVDDKIAITIKKVQNGYISHYINDNIKKGDFIEVMPPRGNFTIELSPESKKEYVFFAGGSGITPLISIIKSILKVEKSSKLTLFYSNHSEKNVIFRKEIEDLVYNYRDRFTIVYIFTGKEYKDYPYYGRVDSEKTKKLLNEFIRTDISEVEFFLCSVPAMMKTIENTLISLGVEKSMIHKESYTNSNSNDEYITDFRMNEIDKIVSRQVHIKLYGEEFKITVEPDETILTAAMRQGYDPPFSCQIGACSTCRAKLLSGKVHMDERDALTDEEIEMGYILTCQSHPLTDNVIIDYDD